MHPVPNAWLVTQTDPWGKPVTDTASGFFKTEHSRLQHVVGHGGLDADCQSCNSIRDLGEKQTFSSSRTRARPVRPM